MTQTSDRPGKATDMNNLKFEDTDVPAQTREQKPNPFREVLPLPDGVAKRTTVPSEASQAYVNMARAAGRECDTTTRVKVEKDSPKKGESTITFWTVPKIVRPRKNKDNGDGESTDESAESE